ncbi:MAG TPA: mRNA surveillance protein pelota [Methanocorpusculum sp.]|nr:mRNA surveillance protein pelota [Methanocorpusculum sp.]
MKATLAEELRRDGSGEYKLVADSLDDLWHLSHLVSAGDTVYAVTLRTVDAPLDKLRAEKLEKRPVRIGITVEKVEFSPDANRLRLFGVIVFGPDLGQHHTINVELGYEISVVKRWRSIDRARLKRAVDATLNDVIHIVTVEDGEIELYRIRQFGPQRITTLTLGSGKTAGIDSREALFAAAVELLKPVTGTIIIAGPGFVKDDFAAYVKTHASALSEKMLVVETRRSGYGAVQEAIGNGVLERAASDVQLAREVAVMDELFLRIGQNGAVAYGNADVQKAADYGAVESILVSDSALRLGAYSQLLEDVEKMGAEIVVLSTSFEPGERLEALGGIAALLRYAIQ